MKRFQECNIFVKFWRYRWYVLIPFKFIYHLLYDGRDNQLMWVILISESQSKMKWYYTSEEVFDKINANLSKHSRRLDRKIKIKDIFNE